MPATYTIHNSLLRICLHGTTSPSEVARCIVAAFSDPDCPDPVALLIDAAASTSLAGRSPDQIRYAVRFLGPHAERIGRRCAMLVSSDVDLGQVRLGGAYAGSFGVETRGFRSEAAALKWLGVEVDESS